MTTQSSWTRFLLSLSAASLLALPALPGCAIDDISGGPGNSGLNPGDDDDSQPDPEPVDEGTAFRGVVRDAVGMPLDGVTVTTSTGYSATSDHLGHFVIDEIDPSERLLVNFRKDGYARTQVPFAIIEDVHNFLSQTMAEVDFIQTFEASEGLNFEIEANGPTVQLPAANFVDSDGEAYDGQVTVEATFYDLTSEMDNGLEIFAAPGDFGAVDANGDEQRLESFGMFQVNLTGASGEELNLATATAPVIMPLQIQSPESDEMMDQVIDDMPVLGETIPAWSYNESTGKWVEEAIGTVVELDDGTLAWSFEAAHFSTWNCDQPLPTHGCLKGTVTTSQGTPRQGATVRAVGMTYTSTTTARTGANGDFCLEVKNGETVWAEISYSIGGQPASQRTDPVYIPAGQATCTDGDSSDCVDLGIIPVDIVTCVQGVVTNSQGGGVEGAEVVSPQGGVTVSDADGAFCMTVPVFQPTEVYVLSGTDAVGYRPEQVYSQPGMPDCQAGCPNLVILQPYAQTSCAAGQVIVNNQQAANIPVQAFDSSFPDIAVFSTLTDQQGSYCIEVPSGSEVSVQVGSGDAVCGSETLNTSGAGGEVCADGGGQSECLAVSDFVCNL